MMIIPSQRGALSKRWKSEVEIVVLQLDYGGVTIVLLRRWIFTGFLSFMFNAMEFDV